MKALPYWRKALLLSVSILLVAGVAIAQSPTGNVYGTVTDESGDPLPGVTVKISGIGADSTQITGATGQFRFLGKDPGVYTVTATLEGMGTTEYPGVQVQVGRNTTVPLTLASALDETITVTSESPLLDERKLTAGTQVSQIELEKIPTARDPWALLNQTPGVLVDRVNVGGNESGQQSNFRAQGMSSNQNDFLVDGVQITDMRATGASSTYYDFDQFTEMQFTTGGTDVTKNTAGVSVNLVTKRGSNEFRGSARFFNVKSGGYLGGGLKQSQPNVSGELEPAQCLPSANQPAGCTEVYQGAQIREIEEMGFEAGGSVVRDKFWLWGSWGQNDVQQNAASGTADDTILENTSMKANVQFSQNNSGVGSWNNGDKLKFGRGAGIARPDITTWNQRGPSAIYRFEDTHVFSSNFFLTGTYSIGDFGFALAAKGGTGPNAPEVWRDNSGVWHDNYLSGFATGPNDEFKMDGSYFFNTGSTSHELKVGGRFRSYESFSDFTWPGRNVFTFNSGSTTFAVAKRGVATPTSMEYMSIWAQDTISFGKATLNVGFRYDDQSGVNEAFTVPANPVVPNVLPALNYGGGVEDFSWTDLTPRVGFTYALGSERDTLLRASFSQFADQLGVGDVSRTNPAGEAYAYFVVPTIDGPFQNFASLNDPNLVDFAAGFDPADPASLVDPDVTSSGFSAPITTEFLAGVEHALMPQFVVGLNFTYRLVEDIDEARDIIRNPDGSTRTELASDYTSAGFVSGTIPASFGGGSFTREVFNLNSGLDFTGGSLLLNGTREREYVGGAVTFTKRLSNRWMLRGFLNFGEAEWKIDSEYLRNSNPNRATAGGDQDGDLYITSSSGSGKGTRYLQSSWTANLNGMYQVAPDRPWGFNISANLQAREGHPLPFFDQISLGGNTFSVGAVNNLDQFRLDDVITTDLRIEKEFNVNGPINMTFGLDAFNVTNEGYALSRERNLSSSRAFFVNDNVSPRVWRLSARLAWK